MRDPRSLIMALLLPFVMIMLFGYALTLDVDRIPTIIYDADRTTQSRELAELFRGSRYFQILGTVGDYQSIEKSIDRNECLLGVVIPDDYSQKLQSGRDTEVQLLLDGSDSNSASIAIGYADALLQTYSLQIKSAAINRMGAGSVTPPVDARLRVWYNSELKSKNFIIPGLIAVILMIISALLTSLTIAREWEMGTMEQILSTPLRPAEMVLGKMSAYFTLGLVDMIIAVTVGILVFDVPLRGNPLFLFFSGCVFMFGGLCWGILISAIARSQLLAYQIGMLSSFLPAFILSGFIYAIENMPVAIQVVTYVVPSRYFITILKGIYLKGAGVEILWRELVFLLIFAITVFTLAIRKMRQKIA